MQHSATNYLTDICVHEMIDCLSFADSVVIVERICLNVFCHRVYRRIYYHLRSF
jgi:hypothetical protein